MSKMIAKTHGQKRALPLFMKKLSTAVVCAGMTQTVMRPNRDTWPFCHDTAMDTNVNGMWFQVHKTLVEVLFPPMKRRA
jgi:hypothetical protein